jgi:hypothetical protein
VVAGRADDPRPILQRDVLEGDPLGLRPFRGFLPLKKEDTPSGRSWLTQRIKDRLFTPRVSGGLNVCTVEEDMDAMEIATITVTF